MAVVEDESLVLEVRVDRAEAPQSRSHQGKLADHLQALGPERPGRLQVRGRDGGLPAEQHRPGAPRSATPRPMPASRAWPGRRPASASPAAPAPASPTVASPRTTGRQYHGPATRPTRNAPSSIRITSRSTRLPWPEWPSRSDRLSRLPRGESRCRTIARASGMASAPSARKAPGLPSSSRTGTGLVGARTALAAHGRAAPVRRRPQVPEGGRGRRFQQVVQRRGPGRGRCPARRGRTAHRSGS